MTLLEGMDNLSDLRIRYQPTNPFYTPQPPSLEDIIAAAKRVLLSSNAMGRKQLRIQHVAANSGLIEEETLFTVGN
jgi:hypothetical protein